MRTKEAPRTSPHEQSRIYEHEQSSASGDSLRTSLLLSGEARGAFVPGSSYAIRCDSRDLSVQTLAELSRWVDNEREARLQSAGTGGRETRSVSSLNSAMKLDRMDGKTSSDMTVLYDSNTSARGNEIHVPSAVIIHRLLSPEEILRIREALPYGVPIIDGETNEFLDDVGRAEREMGREVNAIYRDLGGAAFRASRISEGYYDPRVDDTVTHYTDEYRSTPYDYRRETVGDVWGNPHYFASGRYTPRTESSSTSSTPHTETIEEPVPESEEVRRYRAKKEMAEAEAHAENNVRNIEKASNVIFDAAKDLYDVSSLSDLDENQLRKVERRARRNLHPDKGFENGGDIGAFKETGAIIETARRQKPPTTGEAPDS